MVRSKFPGKPSKIVQRSLVKAFSIVVPSFDTSTLSENVYYGLNVFELTFGTEDEDVNFIGFDQADIDTAYKRKEQRFIEIQEECVQGGLIYSFPCVNERSNVPIKLQTDHRIKELPKKQLEKFDNGTLSTRCKNDRIKRSKVWLLNKRSINRFSTKIPMRHGFKTISKNSLIRFKHKSSNYLSEKYYRKFVLPSHSLHSSRIIKPNKRFMDAEKNLKSKLMFKTGNSLTSNTSLKPDRVEIDSTNYYQKKSSSVVPSNKVIIREARLNIISEPVMAGPFSSKRNLSFDKEKFRSGIITCGVCGATRFYKYVLQTKKFGIHSCEPCRRFILRMIKQSKLQHQETLKCKAENGVGKCVIPATSRTKITEENILSKSGRCPACWLILCLQRYLMPGSVRKLLMKLIPEDVEVFSTCCTLNGERRSSQYETDDLFSGGGETGNLDPLKRRLNEKCFSSAIVNFRRISDRNEIQSIKSKSLCFKRTPLNQKQNSKYERFPENSFNENIEKNHFVSRGPRIKHVCRSASSVLKMSGVESSDYEAEDLNDSFREFDSENSIQKSYEKQYQLNEGHYAGETSGKQNNVELSSQQYGARSLQDFYKESANESEENEDKLISVDFWEAYDPDEIYKTGFPIICSESMNIRAVCFLCGSVGLEKLLYCVCCCEPYHWYCAEGPSAFREETELENCRVSWVCRKCQVCSVCGERSTRSLISCQRCRHSYHTECLSNKALNKRLFKSDRPWVCPTCLKCKSCNGSSVFTFVGNVPLCSLCFKLRQKGNFCPLCQGCYMDEDYNVQMMECGLCKCWIHAKCEGISSEKYQILSFLPETIEFICKLCCTTPPAPWWLAVEDELKTRYLGILKCLCKHKNVSDLFKDSPKKESGCTCRKRQNDSGDEQKCDEKAEITSPAPETDEHRGSETKQSDTNFDQFECCTCDTGTKMKIYRNLLAIKASVHNNQFSNVSSFYTEVANVIAPLEEPLLLKTCHEIVKQFFPWFDPDEETPPDNASEFQANDNLSSSSTSSQNEHTAESMAVNDDYATLRRLYAEDEYRYEHFRMLDVRTCNFCKGMGEARPSDGGRLIYCGRDEWVHSNCALWSSEVYEEIDGSLQNVQSALSRGRQMRCSMCDKKGASVGCCYKGCSITYHFGCAKKAACNFFQNKTVYCQTHDVSDIGLPLLTNEKDFEILRPVYVENDRKKKKFEWHANVRLRIGSLHVESLGKIDPHLSDRSAHIIPINFRCTRLFWSTAKPWKLVQYHIRIKVSYSRQKATAAESDVNYTIDHSAKDEVVHRIVRRLIRRVEENCARRESYGIVSDVDRGHNGKYVLDDDDMGSEAVNSKNKRHDATPKRQSGHKSVSTGKPSHSGDSERCRIESRTESKTIPRTSITGDGANGNCLRDRNEVFFDSTKRNQLNVENAKSFRIKRKLDFENSSVLSNHKLFVDDYVASAAKLDDILGYYSPFENIMQVDGMVYGDEEPVKCVQCHRTYRNTLGFQRHLETCNSDFGDYMISSCESDSTSSEEEKMTYANADNAVPMVASVAQPSYFENAYVLAGDQKSNPQPYVNNVCFNVDYNESIYPTYAVSAPTIAGPVASALPTTIENVPLDSLNQTTSVQTVVQNFKSNGLPISPIVTRTDPKYVTIGNKSCTDYATGYALNDTLDVQNVVAAPTAFVIQSLPKTEVLPTYIAIADGTAVADCNMHMAETYLTQPVHLQQMTGAIGQPASVNFQPIVPSIAIMQPNVVEPTYVVNTAAGSSVMAPAVMAELFSSPQNGLILSNQPPLLGLETIVSNTIMASSQYMAQSLVGGMGASAMYSTTTTQIFQTAAKPLSQPDFGPSFIVLNSGTPAPPEAAVVQPVQYQPTTPSLSSSASSTNLEKCMYVQVNAAQQPKPSVAAARKPPVIVKPAKRNVPNAKKPAAKVIKVKNNRPVEVKHEPVSGTRPYTSNVSQSAPSVDRINKCGLHIEVTDQSLKNINSLVHATDTKPEPSSSAVVISNTPVIVQCADSLGTEQKYKRDDEKVVAIEIPEINLSMESNESCITVARISSSEISFKESSMESQNATDIRNVSTSSLSKPSSSFSTPKLSSSTTQTETTSPTAVGKSFFDSALLAAPSSSIAQTEISPKSVGKSYLNGAVFKEASICDRVELSAIDSSATEAIWNGSVVSKSINDATESHSSSPKPNYPTKNGELKTEIVISNMIQPTVAKNPSPLPPLSPPLAITIIHETKPCPPKETTRSTNDELFDRLFSLPDRQVKVNPKNVVSTSPAVNIPSNPAPVSPRPTEMRSTPDQRTKESSIVCAQKLTAKTEETSSFLKSEAIVSVRNTSSSIDMKVEEPSEAPACPTSPKNKYEPIIRRSKPSWTKKVVNNGEVTSNSSKKNKSPEKENNGKKHEDSLLDTSNGNNWKTASISYEVNAEDGFSYKTNSLLDLWNKILESVQQSRAKYKLPLLPKNASMNAESVYSLLGFENNASKYLLEQLPDAWKCIFYKPVFHKSTFQNGKTSPTESESGCARTEPFTSKHKFDMFGWLASRHRKPPKFMMVSDSDIVNGNRRVTSLNLPMAMRFRQLKETAKETVGVFRSDIHGRGLFCLRDIDAGEMVIEYAGEVIRSTLTDKREKNYTSKGIGCYMFRIDDHYVVDATMCGNAARFINHSCEPNCYSRIVDILGKKHILIFALRRIPKGEELTYDYKFPLEDEKIYCHCLSRKCRKYLN